MRDLHPLGARRFGTIGDCLAQVILNDRSAIVTYDRGAGIGFSDRDVENDFKTVLKASAPPSIKPPSRAKNSG